MKKTIRGPIHAEYSLHEMDIVALEVNGREMIVRTQNGMIRSASGHPVEGHIEFHGVDWGYCYIYLFDSNGNVGPFGGEKKYLIHFLDERKGLSFTVASEVYGENFHIFERPIEYTIRVAECPAAGMSILEYEPRNPAAESYRSLAEEVLRLG